MDHTTNIETLRRKIRLMNYHDTLVLINEYIAVNPDDDRALTLRGMKHWGAGKRALAINDYLRALEINPQSTARAALQSATEILDYRNTDLFNP